MAVATEAGLMSLRNPWDELTREGGVFPSQNTITGSGIARAWIVHPLVTAPCANASGIAENRASRCYTRRGPMNGKNEPITVEIYGQTYNVRGEGDPAYLTELAQFVDQRMRDIASQLSTLDPLKIAILAALNLADELHVTQKQKKEAVGIWMEKAEQLATTIEGTLQTAGNRH